MLINKNKTTGWDIPLRRVVSIFKKGFQVFLIEAPEIWQTFTLKPIFPRRPNISDPLVKDSVLVLPMIVLSN